jgi:hypothetical protein
MMNTLFALLLSVLLSACAAPLITLATLASTEVIVEASKPELPQNGASLFKGAYWKDAEDRNTYTIKGKGLWKCAVSFEGMYYCVDPQEMVDVTARSRTRFVCQLGQGGMFTQLVDKRNASTFFCKRA